MAEGLPPTSRIRGPEPVGPNWTGFYVGAGIGAGAASYDVSGMQTRKPTSSCKPVRHRHGCYYKCTNSHDDVTFTEFTDSGTTDVGAFGVLTVGYDHALRQGWVGGVFADYDFGSGISGDVTVDGTRRSFDHDHSWAIGARLGHLVTPSTLLYGTAGYTQAEFEVGGLGSRTYSGYFVGGGVETFLRDNWTLKLEYRFSQFGEESIVNTADLSADLDPSVHSARLVLSYKLGRHD
jgi:outer membrane immunogenic protein